MLNGTSPAPVLSQPDGETPGNTPLDRASPPAKPNEPVPGRTKQRAPDRLKTKPPARARGRAKVSTETIGALPAPEPIGCATNRTTTNGALRTQPYSSAGQSSIETRSGSAGGGNELGGQVATVHQSPPAPQPYQDGQTTAATQASDAVLPGGRFGTEAHACFASGVNLVAGHPSTATHVTIASDGVLSQLVEQWRRRQDMLRARQRLELQAQAVCRRVVDGDKVAAVKLWADVKADPAHDLRGWLNPFITAMAPLDGAKAEIEKALVKLSRQTPVSEWALGIRGLGELSLAAILGECAIGPGEYKSVSALWKRMGLAVIDGGRQRRIAGAAALDHGYNAERRSLMWNISASLIKAQLRSEKGEDGKKVAGSEYSLGELGAVYLARKVYQNEQNANRAEPWTPAHIHNDAARYMAKRLLRELWQVWRGTAVEATTSVSLSPVALLEAA